MKFGSGALLVAAGLLVLWLAVSGKLSNLPGAWATLNGDSAGTDLSAAIPNAPAIPYAGYPAEAFPPLPALAAAPIA
jgi:hypothetical protein